MQRRPFGERAQQTPSMHYYIRFRIGPRQGNAYVN